MKFKKIYIITICIIAALTGCVKLPERTIREVPEEVTSYSAEQMYLVLAGRKDEIRDVYTDKVFSVEINDSGEKYSDGVDDMIKDYLEKIHVMTEMCKERDIMLSMSDTKDLEKAAENYMKEFSDSGNGYDIKAEDIIQLLGDLKLIDMLRADIIEKADVEVSESDARVMDVIRIEHDTPDAANDTLNEINDNPNTDFAVIARRNSVNSEIELQIGRGDIGETIEEVIFKLEDDEISPVIPCNGKYYIFKCISGYDEEATAVKKEKMAAERQSRAVAMKYEEYAAEHPYELDEEIWNTAVKMCNDNPVVPDIYAYKTE